MNLRRLVEILSELDAEFATDIARTAASRMMDGNDVVVLMVEPWLRIVRSRHDLISELRAGLIPDQPVHFEAQDEQENGATNNGQDGPRAQEGTDNDGTNVETRRT